jgi:hypothetical protein
MDRRQRAERLIELGKSYRPPAAERYPEKDEPNKSAQHTNQLSDDPDRMYYRNRNDFNIDRE